MTSPLEHPAWSSSKGHPSSERGLFPFPPLQFPPWWLGFAPPSLTPSKFLQCWWIQGDIHDTGTLSCCLPRKGQARGSFLLSSFASLQHPSVKIKICPLRRSPCFPLRKLDSLLLLSYQNTAGSLRLFYLFSKVNL